MTLTTGWTTLIRDWARALGSESKSKNTIRIYVDAAKALARGRASGS